MRDGDGYGFITVRPPDGVYYVSGGASGTPPVITVEVVGRRTRGADGEVQSVFLFVPGRRR